MIPTLLLAAGRSSRMEGGDKLLELVGGQPLLRALADRALAVGPVIVTLPSLNHPRRDVLPDAAQVVGVAGQMSDSIRAGVAALPASATGVIILPADMPDITSDDLAAIMAAVSADTKVVRANTEDGKPGHPIYFARSTFPAFDALTGDKGAFRVCADFADSTLHIPLKGQRARLDLDTPADWDRYRKGHTT